MSKKKKNKNKQDDANKKPKKMKRKAYERELAKLEVELVKLQGWIIPTVRAGPSNASPTGSVPALPG